jgi:hypothetical protein
MFIAFLTLLSALSISGVAAYYSIIGLATIFPGAFIPVVIMGSVLEAGKLICASWLYRNWKNTNILLRSYLFFAVIVLSLVTSMGIFGFLSKAHLQNEFADGSVQQKIELINSQIRTEESIITRQQEIINRSFGKDTSTTVRLNQLNERLKQLDKEVEAYTEQGSSFLKGDLVKKGLDLKKTQQAERDAIQKEIQSLTNKSTANTQEAEQKIAASQQKITDLITKRDPLVADKLKLEAEIGPIKYIAALAVDFGWAEQVNTNSAVRWVIIILIFVFDPLAVLMLIAANQSLIRRFPVREDPPEEIIDLEKPDLDSPPPPSRPNKPIEDPAIQQWNSMIEKFKQQEEQERKKQNDKLKKTVEEWNEKLEKFNSKIEKPEHKPIEVIPIKEESISKKIEEAMKEEIKEQPQDVIDRINEEIAEIKEEIKKEPEATPREELSQIVYEPTDLADSKQKTGLLGQVITNKKGVPLKKEVAPTPVLPTSTLSDDERKTLLNNFHATHGKFEDMSDEELKKERDDSNKYAFLQAVPITQDDERNHPPITVSRRAFFQDYVDDVLRGNLTADQLPPDIAKTVALILSDFNDPPIVQPRGAGESDIEVVTTEGLKEKFAPEPETEDRDITEEELDKLIEGFGFNEEYDGKEYDIVIQGGKKIKVPKKKYVQNEEQSESNGWSKIKELDIPEPEKNEIILPKIQNSVDDEKIETVEEVAEDIEPLIVIPEEKIKKHKVKMVNDAEYRQRIEDRINSMITKLENKEIKLKDLSEEDQSLILKIMSEN